VQLLFGLDSTFQPLRELSCFLLSFLPFLSASLERLRLPLALFFLAFLLFNVDGQLTLAFEFVGALIALVKLRHIVKSPDL
jgi:hypothetical protein